MAERRREVVSYTLPPEVVAKIKQLASEQGRSASALVEEVLLNYLKTK